MDLLGRTFAALADPTRRRILERLGAGACAVQDLTEPLSISQQAVSKHVAVLAEAGLVRRRRSPQDGRRTECSLETASLEAIADWLSACRSNWEGRLDRLAATLGERRGRSS